MKENGPSGLRAKTNDLLKQMRQAGEPIWWLKVYGNPYQRPTVDYLIAYNGRFGALELKSTGERPTPAQQTELDDVGAKGGLSGWADDLDGVRRFLTELKRRGS